MDGNIPTIPEFYKDKNIFITGGSGFIGKVLIEKLLRSCPDVGNLYLLMRPKKGKSVEERIKTITDLPVFDNLRETRPEVFKKLKLIAGDTTALGLGISDEDRQLLINDIHIVFHGAASVRFDDPLNEAIIMNTRGTRELALLALEMKQIQVLIHISTVYCLTDRDGPIEERLYPPIANWQDTIKIAETADKQTLNILTKKYMDKLPNTYTFAKSLSEHVINDLCKGKIPTIVIRPSIVISAVKEPIPGWMDNFNGPVGVLVASGKGIVRTMYNNPDIIADYIPVDLISKGLIIASWKKYFEPNAKENVEFINACNNNFQSLTFKQLIEVGKGLNWEYPLDDILWYPSGGGTNCWYEFYIKFLFYQLLPAIGVDTILKLIGQKPMLVRIQRKFYTANTALEYFIRNEWQFINDKGTALEDALLDSDRETFGYDKYSVDTLDYFRTGIIAAKKYLLKENTDSWEKARKHTRRMYALFVVYNILWYLVLAWLIIFKFDLFGVINRKCVSTWSYLTTYD